MGIHCLFPFLKKYPGSFQSKNIRDFKGKIAAVDASCIIHKALYNSLREEGNRSRLREFFQKYLKTITDADVKPWVVFDGLKLPAKEEVVQRRQSLRENIAARSSANEEEKNQSLANSASIKYEDIVHCIEVCRIQDVVYLVAPYEADAQMAYLVKSGIADLVITEDSDLLAYGSTQVLAKMKLNGSGEYYHMPTILEKLEVSQELFLDGCILAGCDFAKNPPRLGIHTAFKTLKESTCDLVLGGIEENLPGYTEIFNQAKNVFLHQTIFDVNLGVTRPLNNWPFTPSTNQLNNCGKFLDKQFALEFVSGNVNPTTSLKCHKFPLYKIEPELQPNSQLSDDLSDDKEIHVNVLEIYDCHQWTVPQFPVLTLHFRKILISSRNGEEIALIESKIPATKGKAICSSHCHIPFDNRNVIVLWEISMATTNTYDDYQSDFDEEDTDESDNDESDFDKPNFNDCIDDKLPIDTPHTLPFKVMGSCYVKERQDALETAHEHMYEHNRHVFARLKAEPENPHDCSAIAVYIMSEDGYDKVGYIAKELTKYVHPMLDDISFKVDVKSIKFRTTFMLIGFYMTLLLTKRGLWDNHVVKASKGVKG